MKEIYFDEGFEFAVEFSKMHEEDTHWLNFKAVECVARCKTNDCKEMEFNNYDRGNGADECTDFEEAYRENPLCNGYIKWDGCMEIHDLNYHFCGYDNVLQRLVRIIYIGAKKILGDNLDDDLAQLNNLNKY